MKLVQIVLRSGTVGLLHRFQRLQVVRTLSTSQTSGFDANKSINSSETADDFERRILGDVTGSNPSSISFFQKLDQLEKAHDRSGFGSKYSAASGSEFLDGLDEDLDENFDTLSDGMDGKLKKAARYFEYDSEEVERDDYEYRPDATFHPGDTYDIKDLDLTKPGIRKPPKRFDFEVTTKEVLQKADFRNVRFLANFITEAGVIIKRNQTKISAKAQRKVAREIKTARAFGLMPFTTMGTKHFVFGKTMEDLDEDYEYETYDTHNFVDREAS